MKKIIVYVGLDYHQKGVQVCAIDPEGNVLLNRNCRNNWRRIVKAVLAVAPHAVVQAAIEACGGAANLAEELVSRGEWSVDLAHPGYVSRMKQSPDKTDFSDARLLADLERVGYVPRVWLPPHYIIELRRLVKHRATLAKERKNQKLRIGALLRDQRILEAPAKPWTRRWLLWLRREAPLSDESRWIIEEKLEQFQQARARLKRVEARMTVYTRNDPLVARLLRICGIGLITGPGGSTTACIMRAAIGRFDRFRSGKQLARFCGATPRNVSSGQRQATAGLIDACDRHLRSTLIEAAQRLKRYVPRWRALAAQLVKRGKPKNVATVAVANRWLRCLYHEMKPLGLGC